MIIHQIFNLFFKYFRPRRMRKLWQSFHLSEDCRVLDVGGAPYNWTLLPQRPRLTILNITPPKNKSILDNADWVIADGCRLPFKDKEFDVVYSNSVIEHLRSLHNQQRFAAECSRVGARYYVQTPNKWFLVEPHLLTPLIHWLPRPIQRKMLRNFTVWGWITRPTEEKCEAFFQEVRLLEKHEFKKMFSDAEIWYERILGWTKSLIAVKNDL